MRITIVMGFFLPMPPAMGGATEKTWHRLALELATRGHEVTIVSRRWRDWPDDETKQGVRFLRLPGSAHRQKLWQNLVLDLRWSLRVFRRLPPADIVVVHAVTLPVWLGRLRPSAGRVVVMPGRIPKGQYRWYGRLARVLVTSSPVRDRVVRENPALAEVCRLYGYPIAWQMLAAPRPPRADDVIMIGFVGRIHPEKGLDLLVEAVLRLRADATLPPWRVVLCGPDDVAAGGGGERYRAQLEDRLRAGLPAGGWRLSPPIYEEAQLADFYRALDIFCYPSLAAEGETFGVAVAEAMAAGAVPVVSDLACFRDFVRAEGNGMVFDHTAPDAVERLANALARLVRDGSRRQTLAAAAQADVQRFDFARYAEALVEDFTVLHRCHPAGGSDAKTPNPT